MSHGEGTSYGSLAEGEGGSFRLLLKSTGGLQYKYIVGASWFRRGYWTPVAHAEVPVASLNTGRYSCQRYRLRSGCLINLR